MPKRTRFTDIAQILIDRWLAAGENGRPERLYAGLLDNLGNRMAINIVHVAAEEPDWRLSWVRNYGFKTPTFDFTLAFPQGRFGDFKDQEYLSTAVMPAYKAALSSRKPRLETVTASLVGLSIGYEHLLLPQHAPEPSWCLSFTEGRFMVAPPPAVVSSDETDQAIAQFLIEGQTAKEISGLLSLSQRTIEHRVDRMKQRYDARNVTHLISRLVSEQLYPHIQPKTHATVSPRDGFYRQ